MISYVKPTKAVTSATISRWPRCVMEEAGINVLKVGAHSVRASKGVWSGARIEDIMKMADLFGANVFVKHYFRPVEHVSNVVLKGFKHA